MRWLLFGGKGGGKYRFGGRLECLTLKGILLNKILLKVTKKKRESRISA